jgi:translocation and assembly module TamB
VLHNALGELRLDSALRVSGELRSPRVEGFVEVAAGDVDVGRVVEEVASTIPYQQQPFVGVEADVGIAVPGTLRLRGTDIRPAGAPIDIGDLSITVGGALHVRKTPDAPPRLSGELNTIRGSYAFQGRRFEILRDGRIRFAGTDEFDPLIDLQASRTISGVETFVRLQGSMRHPELSFSSRPPLDEADILSLIVFNVPINELAEGQQVSLAERAGALAGGYIVSGLTQSIANALELDEFEFRTETVGALGASVSIGQQIGERLFVRIRQGFGATEGTEFMLEYQIAEFLRLRGSVSQMSVVAQRTAFNFIERGGIDLVFFFSF